MKFGKTYEKTLEEQNIPESWIDSSIKYKPLKKSINKVVDEMDKIGLTHEYINQNQIALYYTFNEDTKHSKLRPTLEYQHTGESESWKLSKDEEFFQSLYSQYQSLTKFNDSTQSTIVVKITELSKVIKELTSNNHNKNDMYLWREIFNQYVDFKLDLNSKFTIKNLNQFLKHINNIQLLQKFKHTKSNTRLFENFYQLNLELIQYLSFENLNNIALRKIIKKFDKHTLLKSSDNLTKLLNPHQLASQLSASTIEQAIATNIIKIVPQLDDYTCPICFNLAYKPIRLSCGHFFCLRCMIKLQREGERKCPICRDPVVLDADESNIDYELIKVMKENFPKELKIKKKQNDKEIADEAIAKLYGNGKVATGNKDCIIM